MDRLTLIERTAAETNFAYYGLPSVSARIETCEAEDNIREALKALRYETERDLT